MKYVNHLDSKSHNNDSHVTTIMFPPQLDDSEQTNRDFLQFRKHDFPKIYSISHGTIIFGKYVSSECADYVFKSIHCLRNIVGY